MRITVGCFLVLVTTLLPARSWAMKVHVTGVLDTEWSTSDGFDNTTQSDRFGAEDDSTVYATLIDLGRYYEFTFREKGTDSPNIGAGRDLALGATKKESPIAQRGIHHGCGRR